MIDTFTLNVEDEGKIVIPEEITKTYNLIKGQRLFVIRKQGVLEIITKQSELWEKFHKLLSEIRETVRESGGISDKEIDERLLTIRKAND
jgi:bifunctional DNA-binding transcriptional regulator/antitoxin component of YhaV-PrlF toxin-antitoxin module